MIHDEPGGLLRTIVAVLEAARIPHMVVGSFASTAHGEPRTTRDLDLVIDPTPDQLNELIGALDPERFYVDPDVAHDALRRRSMFNIIEMATGWKLDLVIRKARPFSIEEMQRRTITKILGMDVPTAATGLVQEDRDASRRAAIVDVEPAEHARDRDGHRRVGDRHRARWYALFDAM